MGKSYKLYMEQAEILMQKTIKEMDFTFTTSEFKNQLRKICEREGIELLSSDHGYGYLGEANQQTYWTLLDFDRVSRRLKTKVKNGELTEYQKIRNRLRFFKSI